MTETRRLGSGGIVFAQRLWGALPLACAVLLTFAPISPAASTGDLLARITGQFDARVIATGLSSPDGLAVNPLTGELYVSEEAAGRISVIRNGKAVPVIERNFTVVDDLPEWAVTDYKPREAWLRSGLTSPEGIAFSSEGHLFVVEDTPNGRVLEFAPDAGGEFRSARAIPVPWLEQPFAWEGIVIAEDGRLFLAGSCAEAGGLPYGSVLVRDVDGVWSVVDYGPFASFSAVCLSREEDIVVVGEETPAGGVTWWDAVRRLPIHTATELLPSVEGLCVLPDGSILAAQEEQPGRGGGRLVRIDPQTGASEPAADGFGTIESVLSSVSNHCVYVTEDSSGSVLELQPKKPFPTGEYLLQRSLSGYEVSQGLAPKRWPTFLKQFFTDLGVNPRDETVYAEKKPKPLPKAKTSESHLTVTLQELGSRIPLIAGKLKTSPLSDKQFPDPVQEMNFIVFFPNQMLKNGICTPSLSLFTAKRASGKTEKTQVLGGLASAARHGASGWSRECDNAYLYLPLATCSATRSARGTEVTLTFLGLDVTDDYYLHILLGSENRGELLMEDTAGQLSGYDVDVTEFDERGTERVNIVVTGFGVRSEGDELWLDIGDHPSWGLIKDARRARWVSYWVSRQATDLISLLAKKDDEWKTTDPDAKPKDALEASAPGEPTARVAPPPPEEGPDREASAPTPPSQPPVADTRPPAEHDEASVKAPSQDLTQSDARPEREDETRETSWTNILLSRAISLWNRWAF